MTLNKSEAELLSSLSTVERAMMLKLRFAGLIAKPDNNPHRQKEAKKNLEKINRQTDEVLKKRKTNEEDLCRQHRPAKWLKTSPEQDHEKYSSTTNYSQTEYHGKSRIIDHRHKLNLFNKNVAEEDEKNKTGSEATRLILQSRCEEEEKQKMEPKEEAERKAFRESLDRLEGKVDFEDNFKVMRDFERLITAPRKVSFDLDRNTYFPADDRINGIQQGYFRINFGNSTWQRR